MADALRIGCGVLMLITLIRLLPDARRYFLSERWGGYGERGWRVDLIQNPVVMPALLIAWMGACIALAGRLVSDDRRRDQSCVLLLLLHRDAMARSVARPGCSGFHRDVARGRRAADRADAAPHSGSAGTRDLRAADRFRA